MLQDIPNFLPLTERLLTGGMPTADQLADASRSGVELVINLATFDPAADHIDEGAVVRDLGMEYLHLPVDWERPTAGNLSEFMNAMDQHVDRKMLVHCRANYRATAFVALYRILRLRWKPADAMLDVRRVWNPDEYPVWKKFIDQQIAGAS